MACACARYFSKCFTIHASTHIVPLPCSAPEARRSAAAGLLVVAKDAEAQWKLADQFKAHTVSCMLSAHQST